MTVQQLAEKLDPVAGGHEYVEQHKADVAFVDRLTGLRDRWRLEHAPTVQLQVDTAQEPNGRVVVDDENGVAGRVHRGRKCTRIPIRRTLVLPIENGKRAHSTRPRARAVSHPPARRRAASIAPV